MTDYDDNLVIFEGQERNLNCVFPDCGCAGARNCDAVNGANTGALILNREQSKRND